MMKCDHCGTEFEDPLIEIFQNSVPETGLPMVRHGEKGMLLRGPVHCQKCRELPNFVEILRADTMRKMK